MTIIFEVQCLLYMYSVELLRRKSLANFKVCGYWQNIHCELWGHVIFWRHK